MLDQKLISLIDKKATDLNTKGDVAKDVAVIIERLNDYIDERVDLTDSCIDRDLSTLGSYFLTSLHIPLDPGTKFLRARQFDLGKLERDVTELSYISAAKKHSARQGRFNSKGCPIYYGCIYFGVTGAVNVGFSEINAVSNTSINVLRSVNKTELNVYYIGIYDLVHRDCKPQFMPSEMFDIYKQVYNYQEQKFSSSAFIAHQICDAFFSDILRRKEHGNLYNVTSRLPIFFLEGSEIDGIIYTSVKAEGSPVVALKTKSVHDKFNHISCDAYQIVFDYGYARYQANHTHIGSISGASICWNPKT